MFNRKKFAIFLVGIIGIVSLMACQKPNAQQSNVIDTEGTQKLFLKWKWMRIIVVQIPLRMGAYFV